MSDRPPAVPSPNTDVDFKKAGFCAPSFIEATFPSDNTISDPIYIHGAKVIGLVLDQDNPGGEHKIYVLSPAASKDNEVWCLGWSVTIPSPPSLAIPGGNPDSVIKPISPMDNPHLTGTVQVTAPSAPVTTPVGGEGPMVVVFRVWLMVEKIR